MTTRNRQPGDTTRSGLGWAHKQVRASLLRRLVDGTPCAWCGQPMFKSQQLHADHTVPRSQGGTRADRLLHARCNLERGDGSGPPRRGPGPSGVPPPTRVSRDWLT